MARITNQAPMRRTGRYRCELSPRGGSRLPSPGQRPGNRDRRKKYSVGPTDQQFPANLANGWPVGPVSVRSNPSPQGGGPGLEEPRAFGPKNRLNQRYWFRLFPSGFHRLGQSPRFGVDKIGPQGLPIVYKFTARRTSRCGGEKWGLG